MPAELGRRTSSQSLRSVDHLVDPIRKQPTPTNSLGIGPSVFNLGTWITGLFDVESPQQAEKSKLMTQRRKSALLGRSSVGENACLSRKRSRVRVPSLPRSGSFANKFFAI